MALATRLANVLANDPNALDLHDAVNHFFNGTTTPAIRRPVDVREDADRFIVDAELPGFRKDEIDIVLENQTLTITAAKKPVETATETPADNAVATATYLLRERRTANVTRSFKLPPTVDGGNVEASFADGVLTLVLKKREETKARKIEVK